MTLLLIKTARPKLRVFLEGKLNKKIDLFNNVYKEFYILQKRKVISD